MKRIAMGIVALVGLCLCADSAKAGWGSHGYGGYQSWPFGKKKSYDCCEEERWQRFWHDYYNALQKYYDCLENIDWVTYYKFHGYQINSGMGGPYNPCCRPQYAPVFVAPQIQWAVPSQGLGGAPAPGMCNH